jgi:hypothetical protein
MNYSIPDTIEHFTGNASWEIEFYYKYVISVEWLLRAMDEYMNI